MNLSLYEMLTLNFSDELSIDQTNQKEQVILSVMDNIDRILSSRRGAIEHLEDYGLPDFSKVLQGLPATAHQLIDDITKTVMHYEPRLSDLKVGLLPTDAIGFLRYSLVLKIEGFDEIEYQTEFTPEGRVVLRHLRKQGRIDELP